jgi:hypothetical protein
MRLVTAHRANEECSVRSGSHRLGENQLRAGLAALGTDGIRLYTTVIRYAA